MNENQFGVMLESILDKVDTIAEGQRNIEKNLNEFKVETHERFDRIEDRLDKVENQLGEMKKECSCLHSLYY